MKNWLYPGAKVVCVDDEWSGSGQQSRRGVPCPLVRGKVYTIRAIVKSEGFYKGELGKGFALILYEVQKPLRPDTGFHVSRFRPLQKRQTDISSLKALLTPSREKQKEGV